MGDDAAQIGTDGVRVANVRKQDITVRRFMTGDTISEITGLLHRAYAHQRALGLDPLAGRQDESTTLDRMLASEAYLAVADHAGIESVVGIILFNEHEKVSFPPSFLEPGTAHFAMFAVDPQLQGIGVGVMLLERCEQRAVEIGADRLALSMAEPDASLRRYYERRSYEFVEYWQWPYTNYRSVILARQIPSAAAE
ncbi:MAG: GNAT family N-acetyltransferase [Planctomycetota bacterium]